MDNMDKDSFRGLPRCVECKKLLHETKGVLRFTCHFCVICLTCVSYLMKTKETISCQLGCEEVNLRDLAVDDKLTSLSVLLTYALNPDWGTEVRQAWINHCRSVLEEYTRLFYPGNPPFFSQTNDVLRDFSDRTMVDVDKMPDLTEDGWICAVCGNTNSFQSVACDACRCVNFAWHSLLTTGRKFVLSSDLTEIFTVREVKNLPESH